MSEPGFDWLRHKPPKDYKKIVAPFDPESTLPEGDGTLVSSSGGYPE
jgi:hypothetical protein